MLANASVQLSESGLHPLVEELNFDRLKWKISSSSSEMTDEIVQIAEQEYKRFLTISMLNPGVGLAPTPLMDEMWHAHILDTANYMADCKLLFGRYIHHNPDFGPYSSSEVKDKIHTSSETTMKLYNELYNENPKFIIDGSSKCDGDDYDRTCVQGVCGGGPGYSIAKSCNTDGACNSDVGPECVKRCSNDD